MDSADRTHRTSHPVWWKRLWLVQPQHCARIEVSGRANRLEWIFGFSFLFGERIKESLTAGNVVVVIVVDGLDASGGGLG